MQSYPKRSRTERLPAARPAWSPACDLNEAANRGETEHKGARKWQRMQRTLARFGRVWCKGRLLCGPKAATILREAAAEEGVSLPSVRKLEKSWTTRRKTQGARVWSYNVETMLVPGRLAEVLQYAHYHQVDILALQGTMLSIEHTWQTQHFTVVPCPRSSTRRKDGVAIAISRRFCDKESIRVTHRWQEGRLLGVRLTRERAMDMYILCGYAPNEQPSATHDNRAEAAQANIKEKEEYWSNCNRALESIPCRCAVVFAMDANGSMAPHHPVVGQAGSRCANRPKWNDNGRRCLEVLEPHGLRALNTFGGAKTNTSTWLSPCGKHQTRIDFIASKHRHGSSDVAHVIRHVPVALKGGRDHLIVEAAVAIRPFYRTKPPVPGRLTWDRGKISLALHEWQVWTKTPEEKRDAPTETILEVMKTQEALREHLNNDFDNVADPTKFYDQLELNILKVSDMFVKQPHKRKFFDFSDETLKKIKKKQKAVVRAAWLADNSADSVELWFANAQAKWLGKLSKQAVRKERRAQLQLTADEAAQAAGRRDIRTCYKLINTLAHKPSAAMTTVNDAAGKPCMSAEQEAEVRKQALVEIFQGVEISLDDEPEGEPLPLEAWPLEQLDHVLNASENSITEAVFSMSNLKAAPPIDKTPGGAPRPRGTVIELWKLLWPAAKSAVQTLVNGIGALTVIPRQFKDGATCQLRKPKGDGKNAKDHYRTLNILDHLGKAVSRLIIAPFARKVAEGISPTQYGATPKRSTRDAIAMVDEVFRRFKQRSCKRARKLMVGVLVDLEKAFDLLSREDLWSALSNIVEDAGFTLLCAELHSGTCYLFKDPKSQRVVAKIVVKKGVRQGAVEGPLLFVVAYHTATLKVAEGKEAAGVEPIIATYDFQETQNEHDVSMVTFVDDLIALAIFDDWSEVTAFITLLQDCLEKAGHKMNMAKTEILAIAAGKGSKQLNREITKRQTGVKCGGMALHPCDSVKYLGVMLSASGRSGPAVNARIAAANHAHARLATKVFKKGVIPLGLRVRLWNSLVKPIALYGMDSLLLNKGSLLKLERWQNKKLRNLTKQAAHISHVPNEAVRQKCRVFTIESELLLRRLSWWALVLAPVVVPREGVWDAHAALRTCLLGRLSFEGRANVSTGRKAALYRDLTTLNTVLGTADKFPGELPNELTSEMFSWFVKVGKSKYREVLSYKSLEDHRKESERIKSQSSVGISCDICGKVLKIGMAFLFTSPVRMGPARAKSYLIARTSSA